MIGRVSTGCWTSSSSKQVLPLPTPHRIDGELRCRIMVLSMLLHGVIVCVCFQIKPIKCVRVCVCVCVINLACFSGLQIVFVTLLLVQDGRSRRVFIPPVSRLLEKAEKKRISGRNEGAVYFNRLWWEGEASLFFAFHEHLEA